MTGVSYFQRFSQPENHATNNTLLLLRYFYQTHPNKLQRALAAVLDTSELMIGLEFNQQVRGEYSVPDAVITQKAMRIFVETKRGGAIDKDQIHRHLETIAGGRQNSGTLSEDILITLTKEPLGRKEESYLSQQSKLKGIVFAATTFSKLVGVLREQCADFDQEMLAIVEDYESYLLEEGLSDIRRNWMVAFPCGTSWNENLTHKIYYEPASRPTKAHLDFIGLYRNKTIGALGKVQAVATTDFTTGEPKFQFERGYATHEIEQSIVSIINMTDYYNLKSESKRFYVVDQFYPTEARKMSVGGMLNLRYFDFSQLIAGFEIKRDYSAEDLATLLNGVEWR